ncbi:MAG: YiiX/YebB-like N1pC/P60 family cysteine hydrolase [Phycisphaerae bacterium]|nr:YiiX/YebB-like N1pC/P60 family cysteine hydrolase [Phycisphaerae bacterium]
MDEQGVAFQSGRLKKLTWLCTGAAAAMLVLAGFKRSLGEVRAQILLTLVGLIVGLLLAGVQLNTRRRYKGTQFSKLLTAGVAAIVLSQACYFVLVWTQWKTWTIVWRLWWITMVPSVFLTHLLLLRASRGGWSQNLERLAGVLAGLAAAIILALGFRRDFLAPVAPAYLWTGIGVAGAGVAVTLWVIARWLLDHSRADALSRRAMFGLAISISLITGLAGYYVGRATAHRGVRAEPLAAADDIRRGLTDQFGADSYTVQEGVSTYLGDTRITNRQPFISYEQIDALAPKLKPGDVILERRNWYLSNAFLPGFWPHVALYVGTAADIEKLGLVDHPAIKKHRALHTSPAEDSQPRAIIEAVSEGVILNSLHHSLHADYVAVLRPRVTDAVKAEAIAYAFSRLGTPYDFNFDFDDATKLVCSEVIYQAYKGSLNFKMTRIMGRNTIPPIELARTFAAERGRADRQFDFILFLDADATKNIAREADEATFCESCNRPKELVER